MTGVEQILEDVQKSSRDVTGLRVAFEDAQVGMLVRRAGGLNRAYGIRLATNTAPHRLALRAGALGDDTADRIMARTYAETIVARWWRLDEPPDEEDSSDEDESRDALPLCTPDNVEPWLLEHPKTLSQLIQVASLVENFTDDGEPGRIQETD